MCLMPSNSQTVEARPCPRTLSLDLRGSPPTTHVGKTSGSEHNANIISAGYLVLTGTKATHRVHISTMVRMYSSSERAAIVGRVYQMFNNNPDAAAYAVAIWAPEEMSYQPPASIGRSFMF